jgi:hypothetical protein
MLIKCSKWRRFIFILIFLTLISCRYTRKVYKKVIFQQSLEQTLIVENHLAQDVVLVAEPEKNNHPLPARAKFSIPFRVYTIAGIERTAANKSWYEVKLGTKANVLIEPGKHTYFTAVGEDVKLRVKMPGGQIWEYLFNFGDCWFDQPAEEMQHTFKLEEEPLAGIPVEICP